MLESQKRHNNHIMAESKAGELMALHSSFWLPLAFATLFLIFDMYHVCEHMDCGEKTTCDVVSAYGFALFHSFNSYFPSTLLPFAIFVVLQQGIYHVYAGVDQWKRLVDFRDGSCHYCFLVQRMAFPERKCSQGTGCLAQSIGKKLNLLFILLR